MNVKTLNNTISAFINNTKDEDISTSILMEFESFVKESSDFIATSVSSDDPKVHVLPFMGRSFRITPLQWNIIDYFLLISDMERSPKERLEKMWILRKARLNCLNQFKAWVNQK